MSTLGLGSGFGFVSEIVNHELNGQKGKTRLVFGVPRIF